MNVVQLDMFPELALWTDHKETAPATGDIIKQASQNMNSE